MHNGDAMIDQQHEQPQSPVAAAAASTTAASSLSSCPAASQARLDANRRNAQSSTGPRTEEGKSRSALNATGSGWFARDLRVIEGQEELYLHFEQAWRDEMQPEGLSELEAFHDYVRAVWHKREIVAAQNEAIDAVAASGANPFNDPALARQLDRLHRYEREFEARAVRHSRELRRLQAERRAAAGDSQKRTQPPAAAAGVPQPPPGIPASVLRTLYVMEIETNHWNAQVRARKAGIDTTASVFDMPAVDDGSPREEPAPAAAAAVTGCD